MRIFNRLALAAAIALVAVAAVSGVAAGLAMRIVTSESISAASLGVIRFEANLLGVHIDCNMTLTGTLTESLVELTSGEPIGSITGAQVGECEGGNVRLLVEDGTPWGITFQSLQGTLPNSVTGWLLALEGVSALVELPGIASCLYEVDLGLLVDADYIEETEPAEYLTNLATLLAEDQTVTRVTRLSGFFGCPATPTVLGTFELQPGAVITSQGGTPQPIITPTPPTPLDWGLVAKTGSIPRNLTISVPRNTPGVTFNTATIYTGDIAHFDHGFIPRAVGAGQTRSITFNFEANNMGNRDFSAGFRMNANLPGGALAVGLRARSQP
jgi:hypothetical protein